MTADTATRTMEKTFDIKATPDAVWKALTDAEELMNWFPVDARVTPGKGGEILMSWGEEMHGSRITIWEPGRHLQTEWESPNSPTPLTVDYFIEGKGGATRLRLVHSGFGSGGAWEEEYDGVSRGWNFELRGLRHYLEHHPGVKRQIAWVSRALDVDYVEAWNRIMGAGGLGYRGSSDAGEGERFSFEGAGVRLDGEVRDMFPPRQFAGTVEQFNDAYMRVAIEHGCHGDDVTRVNLWLSAYGVGEQALAELRSTWQGLLDRLFG
jgi:uncharacterized protein YndB with AHSA1/START domain